MKSLMVDLDVNSYPIIITNSFNDYINYMPNNNKKCVIITDNIVAKYCLDGFIKFLHLIYKKVLVFVAKSGEESKSFDVAQDIFSFLISNNVCRDDVIIGFGGGVLGDLAGFVAATFMRGISFVQVPTTLLAQCDSSVGGKNAINYENTKNIVGTIYQPKLVYINYSVLNSLPIMEIKNGLVEVLVHSIIKDELLFNYIDKNLELIMKLNPSVLEKVIYWNCKIKVNVVEKDVFDKGERAILNFGHTFGHAIESLYLYKYKHGECVALGILGACFIAQGLGIITQSAVEKIYDLLKKMEILRDISDCDKGKVINIMMHDKKKSSKNFTFILPTAIGSVGKYEIDNIELIEKALQYIMNITN